MKRDFAADGLNQKWYGDGTEIVTDEGKLHLDSVLDMGSRRIIGHTLGEHHDTDLAYGALAMAVAVRGGKEQVQDVIMHTDQGSEYTARTFREACARCGIRQSMGRVGSALDNAVIESWHSTLEFELRRLEHFTSKTQAKAGVTAWVEEYNHDRRHSALGMRSPVACELALTRQGPSQAPDECGAGPATALPAASVGASSPASRPGPAGGLRPALTPAAGAPERSSGRAAGEGIRQNHVSTL